MPPALRRSRWLDCSSSASRCRRTARDPVTALVDDWRSDGVFDLADETFADWRLGTPDEPVWTEPRPRPLEQGARATATAGCAGH